MTQAPQKLDLDEESSRRKLEVQIVSEEHADERRARIARQSADAKQKWVKDTVLLVLAVIFILALGTSCLAISVSNETTAEDKKWAWSTLTLITGAVLGFLFGKASGKG